MGTTLTGTTPQDTYDSLIKVTDNGPLSGTAKYLSDGLGNDSALALSTSRVGVGTVTPSSPLDVVADNTTAINLRLRGRASDSVGQMELWNNAQTTRYAYFAADSTSVGIATTQAIPLTFGTNTTEQMRITSAGNVGIGTTAPEVVASSNALQVNGAEHSFVRTGTTAFGGYLATVPIVGVTAISNARNPITGTYNNTGVAASVISLFSENANSYITFSTATANNSNPSERVRVTSNGLTFNGDTAAANALDDYEEGTWTPSVAFGGASVGVVLSVANGATYTKIGRQVTVNGFFAITSKGSSTGAATITGLPFTIGNGAQFYAAASLFTESISFVNVLQGRGDNNTTTIQLFEVTEAGVLTTITNADFTDTSNINLSLTYFV